MNNNIDKQIKEWLIKNYKSKSKQAIEDIKKEFGVEIKPAKIYNLVKELKVTHRRQIGECVIRKRGNQVERVFIKIGKNNWVEKSRYVWEQNFGEIPKGMCIIHLNGDVFDDSIDNLGMVTLAQAVYIGHNELKFNNRDELKIGQLLSDIATKRPHYIRPSRRKENINVSN